MRIYIIFIFIFIIFMQTLHLYAEKFDLQSFTGSWKLLESNYYLGEELLQHKGDMNIAFHISVEKNIMKWISSRGITKTFYFDFETRNKTVNTNNYTDTIESLLAGQKLIHHAKRKYNNSPATMNVKNTFILKNSGKTLHHIFEDLNGAKIYKVYSIYGRIIKYEQQN